MEKKTAHFVIIFLLAMLAAVAAGNFLDLSSIFKIVSILILAFIIVLRVSVQKIPKPLQTLAGAELLLFCASFFIYLLIATTGGFYSPFLVIIHITTLALAFIFSFAVAGAFLFAAFIVLLVQIYFSVQSHAATPDISSLIIQLLSIAGTIPFAAFVATRYHLKSQIADYLSRELSVRQSEESMILENIEEGVITLNRQMQIIQMNKIGETLTGFKNSDVAGHDFFETFKFFDKSKNAIHREQFPIDDLLKKRMGFAEKDVYMDKRDQIPLSVDFRLSSILSVEGTIEGFIFVFSPVRRDEANNQTNRVLDGAFDRFEHLISPISKRLESLKSAGAVHPGAVEGGVVDTKEVLASVEKDSKKMLHAYNSLVNLYRLSTGQIPGLLSNVDVGEVVHEVFRETEDLAREYNVEMSGGTLYSPPLPFRTNRVIFKEVIQKVIELCIFIAPTSSSDKKAIAVTLGTSADSILVFIKGSCGSNFYEEYAENIFKPFFGKLNQSESATEASGLEGYLARSLLEERQVGGQIEVSRFEDSIYGTQIVFKLSVPFSNAAGF